MHKCLHEIFLNFAQMHENIEYKNHIMKCCLLNDTRNGYDVMNRNSSMSSSVLRYVLDKGQYFNLEFCLYPILYPNKEAERQKRGKQLISRCQC